MSLIQDQNADQNGVAANEEIDVSLLEDSLRLSPWQRLKENERALALVRMLEAARLQCDGLSKSDS